MESPNRIQDVPVSVFLAVSIVVVFSLYVTSAIKTIPCGGDVMSAFYSNFVHVEWSHLLVNLFALYALSRVELATGGKNFTALVIFLLIFTSAAEVIAKRFFPNLPCSIGFSGVLFGIATWEMVMTKELDFLLVASVVAMVVLPSLQDPKASLLGHAVGAFAGVLGGLLWKNIGPALLKPGPKS